MSVTATLTAIDPGGPTMPAPATTPAQLKAGLDALAVGTSVLPFTLERLWLRGVGQTIATGRCTAWNEALNARAADRFVVHAASDPLGATVDGSGNVTSKGLYLPAGSGAGTQATGKRLLWGVSASAVNASKTFTLVVGSPNSAVNAGIGLGPIAHTHGLLSGGGYVVAVTGPTVNTLLRPGWFSISPKSHFAHHGVGREWVHLPHCYNTNDIPAAGPGNPSSYLDNVYAVMMPEGSGDRAVYLNAAAATGITQDGTETISCVWQGSGTLTQLQNRYLNDFLETYAGAAVVTAATGVAWGDSLWDQRQNGANLVDERPAAYSTMEILNGGVSGHTISWMAALFDEREGRADYSKLTRLVSVSGEGVNEKVTNTTDLALYIAWQARYKTLGANVRHAAWMPLVSQSSSYPAPAGSGFPHLGYYMRDQLIQHAGVEYDAVDLFTDNPYLGQAARDAYATANGAGTFDPLLWNDTTHPKNPEGYVRAARDPNNDTQSYLAVAGTGGRGFGFDRGAFKYLRDIA